MINQYKKKILVTCALPYANGKIHLGHLLEQIQADIWVRFQKMQGHEVYFICGDDAHGTPIMIKSKKLKISPKRMIKDFFISHKKDFSKFRINHSYYYTTHSKENKSFLYSIFNNLKKKNLIFTKQVTQLYDNKLNLFLPDRFISGTCPKCQAKDQYGDICEKCNSVYNSINLINPNSILSNTTPIPKKTKNLFFNFSSFKKSIKEWVYSNSILQEDVKKNFEVWMNSSLDEWNISRDEPYFGFKIPGYRKK